jgi:uncharacterized membrane protein
MKLTAKLTAKSSMKLAVALIAMFLLTGAPADAEDGGLFIPAGDITEKAVFYPLNVDGVDMEVFAVKAPDGTIRTAFNTCQLCYDSGYGYFVQDGGVFVCQNCGNRFKASDIETVNGGCNPLPITKDPLKSQAGNFKSLIDADNLMAHEILFFTQRVKFGFA